CGSGSSSRPASHAGGISACPGKVGTGLPIGTCAKTKRFRMSDLAARPLELGTARTSRDAAGTALLRLIAGLVILLVWEVAVRVLAPAYVAKPSGVIAAIPRVIIKPEFLVATGQTLLAVAEGLAIALVLGTLIGLAIGRSIVVDRMLRHYV